MDNLRNLFGQVSAMTSMKPSTASPSFSASSSASVSGSVGGAGRSGGGVNGTMRTHKTADRDSYYYIMWRS
ncbi:uncharacterized protein LOC118510128 [Anopheles stephensi]|uniref:uncharacterized protein LOC118510128 n=1 Tax=Anopheles stephensi TaxID=30069 RepID=UPI0016588207|nr:uncharacterized protein LOC118510128 [Anopheles stephensi]XP_035907494.1 uncharacterized protein LOC118510128 [Anopheles stephensi]